MLIKSQKQYYNEIEYITSTLQKLIVYELFAVFLELQIL